MRCRICGDSYGKYYTFREMYYGTREPFEYWQCSSCGCLQIRTIPEDLGKYYPSDYYSYQSVRKLPSRLRTFLKCERIKHLTGQGSVLGRLVARVFGVPIWLDQVIKTRVKITDRVVDFGCGAGELLAELKDSGLVNLLGVDPYARWGSTINGVPIVHESTARADVILCRSTFEHVPDPYGTLLQWNRMLDVGGRVLLTVPLTDSAAWWNYRENWVGTDPPRHLHIPSRRSITLLAAQTGFTVTVVIDDSTGFQFWGSELYKLGLPLSKYFQGEYFSKERLKKWEQRAKHINALGIGDSAAIYLTKLVDK